MRPEEFLAEVKLETQNLEYLIPACIRCEAVFKGAGYKTFLMETAEHADGAKEKALALFYAWKETGSSKWEDRIREAGAALEALLDCRECIYSVQPFFMAYDTTFGKKEHYAQIVRVFKGLELSLGWEMMALIDVIDVMSEEIFEQYKAMKVLFKEKLAAILEERGGLDGLKMEAPTERAMAAYLILAACQNETILVEKYLHMAVSLWATLKDSEAVQDGSDLILKGICMQIDARMQAM